MVGLASLIGPGTGVFDADKVCADALQQGRVSAVLIDAEDALEAATNAVRNCLLERGPSLIEHVTHIDTLLKNTQNLSMNAGRIRSRWARSGGKGLNAAGSMGGCGPWWRHARCLLAPSGKQSVLLRLRHSCALRRG